MKKILIAVTIAGAAIAVRTARRDRKPQVVHLTAVSDEPDYGTDDEDTDTSTHTPCLSHGYVPAFPVT